MKSAINRECRKQNARMDGRTAFDANGKEHFFLWRWKADKMKKSTEWLKFYLGQTNEPA